MLYAKNVSAIEFLFQDAVSQSRALATDRYFLNSFQKGPRQRAAVLRVYTTCGDLVSAGRFHLIGRPVRSAQVWRRLSGGRALPFGDGFVAFSLLLPHRSALVADDALALSPYQVPNRYARGVLRALKALGIEAFHPGRDFLTVRRRVIGMVTFETDERGACLFEGIVAAERDFGLLPDLLADVDPAGHLRGETMGQHGVTCIRAETGGRVEASRVAEAIRRGFAEQFEVEIQTREIAPLEERAIHAIEAREFGAAWLESRTVRDELDLIAATPVPLGVFEVRLALEQDRFVREVQLSGDFIANSNAVESLERELKLCPADWRHIALITDQVFNRPENFILGIGKLRTIPDTIVRALPA